MDAVIDFDSVRGQAEATLKQRVDYVEVPAEGVTEQQLRDHFDGRNGRDTFLGMYEYGSLSFGCMRRAPNSTGGSGPSRVYI